MDQRPEAPDLRFPIEELQNFCSLRLNTYENCCDLLDLKSSVMISHPLLAPTGES
jgi:hypothetical protein